MDLQSIRDFVSNWRAQNGIAGDSRLTSIQTEQFARDLHLQGIYGYLCLLRSENDESVLLAA